MQWCICRYVFVFFSSVSEATPFFSEKARALPQLTITLGLYPQTPTPNTL